MKILLLFILCIIGVYASDKQKDTRIVNGSFAKLGQFPWHVGLELETKYGIQRCGGSLVHPNIVMTAAHCIEITSKCTLRFGSTKFSSGGIVRNSTNFLIHKDYNTNTLEHDIAVVFVDKAVPLNDNIKIIDLPFWLDMVGVGETLFVSGFGYKELNEYSEELLYADVKSISNEDCKAWFPQLVPLQVCCEGKDSKSTCTGDSGSPLVKYTDKGPVQVGITSFVHRIGCFEKLPFGFLRTNLYTDFIQEAIDSLNKR